MHKELGITRAELVSLAFFLGSDYCAGVNGIGIVNALEVLQAFPMNRTDSDKAEDTAPLPGLRMFKDWLGGFDFVSELVKRSTKDTRNKRKSGKKMQRKKKSYDDEAPDNSSAADDPDALEVSKSTYSASSIAAVSVKDEYSDVDGDEDESKLKLAIANFEKKHRGGRSKWSVPASFPEQAIVHAYLNPVAKEYDEDFAWTDPNLTAIRVYCTNMLGWTHDEVSLKVDPVLKRFMDRPKQGLQSRIDSHFFSYDSNQRFAKVASERLRSAITNKTGSTKAVPTGLETGTEQKETENDIFMLSSVMGSRKRKSSRTGVKKSTTLAAAVSIEMEAKGISKTKKTKKTSRAFSDDEDEAVIVIG